MLSDELNRVQIVILDMEVMERKWGRRAQGGRNGTNTAAVQEQYLRAHGHAEIE